MPLSHSGPPHTTGGVFASFANLGDFIVAEPGALIGFAGPRVVEQVVGTKLPDGTHTAEFLLAHGMIDWIVDRREQREFLVRVLTTFTAPRTGFRRRSGRSTLKLAGEGIAAWDAVQRARDDLRLTSLDLIGRIFEDFTELHGDRTSGDDPAIVAGLGRLEGKAVAIMAWNVDSTADRAQRHDGRPIPKVYRKAGRSMELAERLHLPLDYAYRHPGAFPGSSPKSEDWPRSSPGHWPA